MQRAPGLKPIGLEIIFSGLKATAPSELLCGRVEKQIPCGKDRQEKQGQLQKQILRCAQDDNCVMTNAFR
jgi:hypothetical protein